MPDIKLTGGFVTEITPNGVWVFKEDEPGAQTFIPQVTLLRLATKIEGRRAIKELHALDEESA